MTTPAYKHQKHVIVYQKGRLSCVAEIGLIRKGSQKSSPLRIGRIVAVMDDESKVSSTPYITLLRTRNVMIGLVGRYELDSNDEYLPFSRKIEEELIPDKFIYSSWTNTGKGMQYIICVSI